MMKRHADRNHIFEEKRQKTLEKNNTSKEGYDANYEIGWMQTFISKFKNRQLRKLEKESNKKIKELEDKQNN